MKNKFLRELNAVITIGMREITLFLKSPAKLIMSLIFPILFLGLFGGQLSQNMGMNMNFDFTTFMLVGMLVQTIFMVMGNGVVSLVEDRDNEFNQEMLVSPVSRYSLVLGKIAGSAVASYIVFFFTIGVGYLIGARLDVLQFLALLAFSPLICLAAGALGVVCIGFIEKPSTAGIVIMLSVMAQTFLSGALIPVNNSTGVMAVVSRLLPMTYCVDFMRGVFYQTGGAATAPILHSPLVNLVIIIAFTAIFLVVGTAGFVRAEKNR
jgi:ABC-2 type transport system permease protein